MNIFILHGWAYETSKWSSFISLINKSGYKANLLKIPGLTEEIEKPWTVADYTVWLNTKIGKETDNILIGHSNGGRIAIAYSQMYPEKVKKLILIDSAGIYHKEMLLVIKRYIFKALARAGKSITASAFLRKVLYMFAREKDYRDASPFMRITMQNLINYDVSRLLTRVKAKTLIIWGEKDRITPLKDAIIMNEKIQGSTLEIIKSAGHSPQFSHPSDTWQKIVNFI